MNDPIWDVDEMYFFGGCQAVVMNSLQGKPVGGPTIQWQYQLVAVPASGNTSPREYQPVTVLANVSTSW
jgi:hypothetical protein